MLRIALVFACGILLAEQYSSACQCIEPKPPSCQETWSAAAVFIGTVVQGETIEDEQNFPWIKVHLSVTERFVGLAADVKEIDILNPWGEPACEFDFKRGRSYLVYADKMTNGALRTNRCARTALIEDAAPDLIYLRSLPTRKPNGEITGVAFDSQVPMPAEGAIWPWSALPDVRITIRSNGVRKTAITDSKGHFAFADLPPGRYSVAAARRGYGRGNPLSVTVPAKGCAEVDFNLNLARQN
jgi:Carboxypeptidase regulatory-like domain